MKIENKSADGVDVVLPEGRLDAQSSDELKQKMDVLIGMGCKRVVVNFDQIEYISSSGLRVMLASLKRIRDVDGDLKLACLKPQVKEIFEIAGFTQLFEIYDQEGEAICGFEGDV